MACKESGRKAVCSVWLSRRSWSLSFSAHLRSRIYASAHIAEKRAPNKEDTTMPMDLSLYPKDWPQIAERLKKASNYTCEECGAQRGQQVKNRHGSLVDVQIGVAHLDHNPWRRNARLKVMCRSCHIKYDAKQSQRKRAMMQIARGQLVLPLMRRWYQAPLVSRQSDERKEEK